MSNKLEALKEPFAESELEWRIQKCGVARGRIWAMVLTYVSNRAIMNRLDDVVGPIDWKNEFCKGPDGGVICKLSIRVHPSLERSVLRDAKIDYEWITKEDGADNTQYEPIKGGLSDSMKRAAVQWGIGRYLYNLDTQFAIVREKYSEGRFKGVVKDGDTDKRFSWDPPDLPGWAKLPFDKEMEKESM